MDSTRSVWCIEVTNLGEGHGFQVGMIRGGNSVSDEPIVLGSPVQVVSQLKRQLTDFAVGDAVKLSYRANRRPVQEFDFASVDDIVGWFAARFPE